MNCITGLIHGGLSPWKNRTPDMMNTESARKIAQSRHAFMVNHLKEWTLETIGIKEDINEFL